MVPAGICWPSVQRIAAITKDPFFETTKPLNRWTAVEFLRAKQNLKFKTAELTMRIIGKKGMVTALSNLQKQADSRDCVMDDLPLNPAALSLELDALGKTCTELDTEAQVCKKVDYEALKQNYIDLKVEVDTKQISYEEITVALEFKVSHAGKLSRQTYQQNHWQLAKITTNLRLGGFVEPHAKFMASFMYSVLGDDDNAGQPFEYPKGVMVDPAEGEFCDYLVTVFTPKGDMEESAYFTSIQMSSIDEKVVRTLAAMRENPRWVGCVGMIDTPVQKDAFKTFSDAISEMDGARTFLVAFLANQMRCGVAGTALPLFPALYYGSCDLLVWLHFIDAEAFLKDGITYDALGSFIASPAGEAFLQKHSVIIPLEKNAMVFTPAGYCLYATSRYSMPACQRRSNVMPMAHFCHIPLGGRFVEGLPEPLRNVIATVNRPHLEAKAHQSDMWKLRLEYFNSFAAFKP